MFSFLKRKTAAPEIVPAPVAPPPPKKSDAEMLVDSVTEFRKQMKDLAARAHAEHKASLEDAKKKIAYADALVKKAGLDKSLPLILKETWHWASWSKREDMTDLGKNLGIDIVGGEEGKNDGEETKTLSFRYEGTEYVLVFIKQRSYVDPENTFGKIRLSSASGETLLSMTVMQTIHQEYDDWRYVSVDALSLGPWVGHVVEIEEKFKAAAEERMRGYEAKFVLDQARDLPPPMN